jgi:DNA-binding NtrC family response regulator
MCKDAQIAMYIVADGSSEESAKNTKDAVMTKLFRTVLNDTKHNASAAARRLNMSREHLYYYLKKYGIKRKK